MDLIVANYQVVYFCGLTGTGKDLDRVLLKLMAKCGASVFSVWVKPPQSSIFAQYFKAGSVKCRNGELFVHNILKPSVPLRTALIMFHAFLKSAQKPVVLVGHSIGSVSEPFLTTVQETQTVDLFRGVIAGFTNALDIWRNNRRERKNIELFKLSVLSRDFLGKQYSVKTHDAEFFVMILAELGITISTESQFIENCESYEEAFAKLMNTPERFSVYKGLDRLLSLLPEEVARKMAESGFSYDSLERVFRGYGSEGLKEFLTHRSIEARLRTFRRELSSAEIKKIVANIVGFFEEQDRRRNQVGSSSADQPRSTMSEPTRYQAASGANPGYQNFTKLTSSQYQVASGAGPVYGNPAEPTSFSDQVPSGADSVHQNTPE